jgi:D-glycero-D-manno-heptose 1,7-bisphosphate phosphatase
MNHSGKAAIFLDRDGTIIEDRGYLRDPSDITFYPGTFEVLQRLQNRFLFFIVTNQTGVAQGVITIEDVERINRRIVAALSEKGIAVTDVYVCPHRRSDNCVCIKPKPYFLQEAARDYCIDLQRSFVVGDHPHDIQLAKNAGACGIYVLTGHGRKHLIEVAEHREIVAGIVEAAEEIATRCHLDKPKPCHERARMEFVLNLATACDLWRRPDLGAEPEHAKHVADVLMEVGIEVYEVHGGWLACEPRPAGVWEALTGGIASANWVEQYNCPPENAGSVLRILADKGIAVSDL